VENYRHSFGGCPV